MLTLQFNIDMIMKNSLKWSRCGNIATHPRLLLCKLTLLYLLSHSNHMLPWLRSRFRPVVLPTIVLSTYSRTRTDRWRCPTLCSSASALKWSSSASPPDAPSPPKQRRPRGKRRRRSSSARRSPRLCPASALHCPPSRAWPTPPPSGPNRTHSRKSEHAMRTLCSL